MNVSPPKRKLCLQLQRSDYKAEECRKKHVYLQVIPLKQTVNHSVN